MQKIACQHARTTYLLVVQSCEKYGLKMVYKILCPISQSAHDL